MDQQAIDDAMLLAKTFNLQVNTEAIADIVQYIRAPEGTFHSLQEAETAWNRIKQKWSVK